VTNHVSEIFAKVTIFEWKHWMGSAAAVKQFWKRKIPEMRRNKQKFNIRNKNDTPFLQHVGKCGHKQLIVSTCWH